MANEQSPIRHRRRQEIAGTNGRTSSSPADPVAAGQTSGQQPADYEVGYGKPPKSGQFQPGRSGNPKGRPKGSKNFRTELAEELQEPIVLTEGGKRRKMSKQRAMLKSHLARAIKGDPRSATLIFNQMARHLDPAPQQPGSPDEESRPEQQSDAEILEAFIRQIRAGESGDMAADRNRGECDDTEGDYPWVDTAR